MINQPLQVSTSYQVYDLLKLNFYFPINFIEILDTAGMEEYEVMQETWINQGKGFLLVYSIDDDVTFQEIKKIKKRIDRIKNFEKVSAILLGNKADLEDNRKVTR